MQTGQFKSFDPFEKMIMRTPHFCVFLKENFKVLSILIKESLSNQALLVTTLHSK